MNWTVAAVVGAAATHAELQWLPTYGSPRDERWRRLPGDDLCMAPQATTTYAIAVDTPHCRRWPWFGARPRGAHGPGPPCRPSDRARADSGRKSLCRKSGRP
jgi:hypothetical protein